MVKKIKKNINKIIIAITLMLSLISISFISTRTYAYSIDNNGNLVGDNILKPIEVNYNLNGITCTYSNGIYTFNGTSTAEVGTSLGIVNLSHDGFRGYVYYNSGSIVNGSIEYTWASENDSFYMDFTRDSLNYSFNNVVYNTTPTYLISLRFYCGSGTTFNNYKIQVATSFYEIQLEQWEPYGIWYSENNYNDMENYYIDLLGNNSNVMYNALYGQKCLLVDSNNYNRIFAQDIMYPTADVKTFSDISLPNIFNYLNNYNNEDTSTYPTPYFAFIVNFNFQITNPLMFEYNNTVLDVIFKFKNTIAENELNEQRDNTYPYFSVQNKEKFAYNQLIYDGIYMPDYGSFNFNLSIDGVAYANGYQDGINSQQGYINIINNDKISLKKEIDRLEEQIKNGNTQQYNEGYNKGYAQGANSNNSLYNMVIAIADTPINIFKQIFNFNILGIDISGFIFGIVSLLIIIWLIKKII